MTITYVKGDILDVAKEHQVDIIAHGCNCFHTMGAGVAARLAKAYPAIVASDKESTYGDINKLGKFTKAHAGFNTWIYNIYTQYTAIPYSNVVQVSWACVHEGLWLCVDDYLITVSEGSIFDNETSVSMVIPMIGAGLAGGSVSDFKKTIELFDNDTFGNHKIIVASI